MIVRLCLSWWYGHGMRWVWQRAVVDRLNESAERFSIAALTRTLFAPYKQTFTGQAGSGVGEMFRSMIDTSISRVVGFLVRSMIIFVGLLHALFVFVTGMLLFIVGPFLPFFIVVSILVSLWLG